MSDRALQPAPEPVDEPIFVTMPDGKSKVVEPGTDEWLIAWAYREEKASRELAERDLRAKRSLIRKLQDDQDAKRKTYGKRDVVERVFERWRLRSGHTGAKLTPERFDAARARIEERYDELHMHMTVEGLCAAAVVKDGKRYDDFDVCMRSGSQLERYANLCPPDVRQQLQAEARAAKGDQMEMQP